jgi:hypothetical protein
MHLNVPKKQLSYPTHVGCKYPTAKLRIKETELLCPLYLISLLNAILSAIKKPVGRNFHRLDT